MFRRQLPAYSPLPLRAVGAAVVAKLGAGRGAEDHVRSALERHYAPRKMLLTTSGTIALEMAIAGAVTTNGGAVALPAYSCFDIATAADGANAPVVLYDINPVTLGPDPNSLRAALGMGARTIVAAHLYGVPIDVAEVRQIADEEGAILIEDCAQAIGAEFHGTPVGTSGALTILSFGRGKGVTAGAGGALLALDDTGVASMESVMEHPIERGVYGWSKVATLMAQWCFGRPWLYGVPASIPSLRLGETIYHEPGLRGHLGTPGCAALSHTWPLASADVARRRVHANRLRTRLSNAGLAVVGGSRHSAPSYLRLPVVMPAYKRRTADSPQARALGIMPGYPKPLSDLARFRGRCRNGSSEFVGARTLADRLITIPTHSRLREADLRKLEAWIDGVAVTVE